jgi:hypothetical protein
MSHSNDPLREGEADSGVTSSASPSPPPDVTPNVDPEKNKALADEINNILKGIPFIGPYIVIVKLKWGWTGILLLIGGFLIATVFVFTGLFPEVAVSDRYKNSSTTSPAAGRDYELNLQQDVLWDAAIHNARTRIWASGVALRKLNPQLIAGKVKEGVTAQVVYVNPCGDTITKRQADENNPNASTNIKSNLKTFETYTKDFNQTQRNSLQVKLTDAYPTMVVVIIDDDLYAYFCPYGAVCSDSPVLVFKGYQEKKPKNVAAEFFEDHFMAISNRARAVTNYGEPCPLSTQ